MVPQRPIGLKSTKILTLWRILGHATVGYHHIFSKTGAQKFNVDTMHWRREQHWSISFPELVGAHFLRFHFLMKCSHMVVRL